MHFADINAALIKAKCPPSQVARELDVSPAAVTQVIRGTSTSYNIATYISAVTSIPLKRLWPDGRYNTAPKEVAA